MAAAVLAFFAPGFAVAERRDENREPERRGPVYQRRAFDWRDKREFRHDRGRDFAPTPIAPQVSAGWFQRPYPYHLDYYRMRYGGSYAPYFGNLYGPPQVVTAPPYYGPYYGGYEAGYQSAYGPDRGVYATPAEAIEQNESSAMPANGDELPAP